MASLPPDVREDVEEVSRAAEDLEADIHELAEGYQRLSDIPARAERDAQSKALYNSCLELQDDIEDTRGLFEDYLPEPEEVPQYGPAYRELRHGLMMRIAKSAQTLTELQRKLEPDELFEENYLKEISAQFHDEKPAVPVPQVTVEPPTPLSTAGAATVPPTPAATPMHAPAASRQKQVPVAEAAATPVVAAAVARQPTPITMAAPAPAPSATPRQSALESLGPSAKVPGATKPGSMASIVAAATSFGTHAGSRPSSTVASAAASPVPTPSAPRPVSTASQVSTASRTQQPMAAVPSQPPRAPASQNRPPKGAGTAPAAHDYDDDDEHMYGASDDEEIHSVDDDLDAGPSVSGAMPPGTAARAAAMLSLQEGAMITALYSYSPSSSAQGELSFRAGERFQVIESFGDWIKVVDGPGRVGYVPSTYFEPSANQHPFSAEEVGSQATRVSKPSAVHGDDDDDDDDDVVADGGVARVASAVQEGAKEERAPGVKRANRISFRDAGRAVMADRKKTTAADVLRAFGAMPMSFRETTLHKLREADERYRASAWLRPRLTEFGVGYRDLHWDFSRDKLRLRPVSFQRSVLPVSASNVPLPGVGVTVLQRFVSIAICDGNQPVSNVWQVPAFIQDSKQTPPVWKFVQRGHPIAGENKDVTLLVRTSLKTDSLRLVFELAIKYRRDSDPDEMGILTCGWASFALFNPDGTPARARNTPLELHGGTLAERGIRLNPDPPRPQRGFWAIFGGSKPTHPQLMVKVAAVRSSLMHVCNGLPETVVFPLELSPLALLYRESMADLCLKDPAFVESQGLTHRPVATLFPTIADAPEMLLALKRAWVIRTRVVSRAQKRNPEFMRFFFESTIVQKIWPLLNCFDLPATELGKPETEQVRYDFIQKFLREDSAALLCTRDTEYVSTPFDVAELCFDIHSVAFPPDDPLAPPATA